MGHEVEQLALKKGHEVLFRLNSEEDWTNAGAALHHADVVIDFSWPSSAVGNIRRAFDLDIPIVIGTTGWDAEARHVRNWCLEEKKTLFAAANFSIGVNIMLELTKKLAGMADRFKDYEVSIEEIHHIHKLDAPSGTAIRIAEAYLENQERMKGWTRGEQQEEDRIPVKSIREGEVPGTHVLKAESAYDSLEIIHQAKGRQGFASGALMAAEWVQGRRGFFTMKDLLEWTD